MKKNKRIVFEKLNVEEQKKINGGDLGPAPVCSWKPYGERCGN